MKVQLSDGRIAEAYDVFAGKMRQVSIDGELRYWPREQMEEVKTNDQLSLTVIPAIERLEDLWRYEKMDVINGMYDADGADSQEYRKLLDELRAEAREELRTKYGV